MVRRHSNPVPLEAHECPQMHADEVSRTPIGNMIPLVNREMHPAPRLAKCRQLVRKRKRKPGRVSRPGLERCGVTIPRIFHDLYIKGSSVTAAGANARQQQQNEND